MTAYLTKTDRVDADYVWLPPGGELAGFWMIRMLVTRLHHGPDLPTRLRRVPSHAATTSVAGTVL